MHIYSRSVDKNMHHETKKTYNQTFPSLVIQNKCLEINQNEKCI